MHGMNAGVRTCTGRAGYLLLFFEIFSLVVFFKRRDLILAYCSVYYAFYPFCVHLSLCAGRWLFHVWFQIMEESVVCSRSRGHLTVLCLRIGLGQRARSFERRPVSNEGVHGEH